MSMGIGITGCNLDQRFPSGSTPPAWVPTSIGGCVLWLPPDLSYMQTADVGDPGNPTVDGESVGRWLDASGIGNDGTQGSATARPSYYSAIQNSLPMVSYDGGDHLSVNGVASSIAGSDTAFTIAIVHKFNDTTGIDSLFSAGRSATNTPMLRIAPNATFYQCYKQDDTGAGVGITGTGATRDTAAHLWLLRFNGTTVDAWIDSTQINTATAQDVGQCTFDIATLGRLISFGVNQDLLNTGYIGEVAVWNNAISNADALTARTEFIAKWAL